MGGARRTVTSATAGVATCLAAATLASCGMVEALGDDDAGAQSATVGVLVPREGWQAADGAGVLAAVRLAIAETADDIGGWTVEVVAVDEGDDADDADDAVAAVEELVDADVVAVIGGLSTAAVRAVQPVLDQASVPFVSPADVDPTHTRGADPHAPLRPYGSYFRTAVTDEPPAATLARYAVVGLGVEKALVVDGGDAAEAEHFAQALDEAGGASVGSVRAGGVTAIANAVHLAQQEEAEAVFVAGAPSVASVFAEQAQSVELDVQLLGTTSMRDDEFVGRAGDAGDGAVTVVPPSLTPTAGVVPQRLAAGLEAAGEAEPGEFGAAAYDAGAAVGAVLSRCLPPASSASSARRGCAGEMVQVDFAGVTGEVAFDEFGDRLGGVSRVEILRDGEWTPVTED